MRLLKFCMAIATASFLLPVGTAHAVTYMCDGKVATYVGTSGDDVIDIHNPGDDVVVALGGNDVIYTHGGRDTICAGRGADFAHSGGSSDNIFGGAGADGLYGEEGNDNLTGGPGSDGLMGAVGDDTLYAKDGEVDALHASSGFNVCYEDPIDQDHGSCQEVH